jgi:pyridoxal biosynthesis lyase PdxS
MAGADGTNGNGAPRVGTDTVKMGLAQMLKGGVIVSQNGAVKPGATEAAAKRTM